MIRLCTLTPSSPRGNKVFLQQQLHCVRNRLPKAEYANFCKRNSRSIWTDAILNQRANLALRINRVGDQAQNHSQKPQRLCQRCPHEENLGLHQHTLNIHK